jgi:RND superfamily putative drug exporter
VLLMLSLTFTPALESALKETGAVYEAGEAYRTEQHLKRELNTNVEPLTLVLQNEGSKMNQAEVERLLNQIRAVPGVSSVVSAAENPEQLSTDKQTQYSVIQLQNDLREPSAKANRTMGTSIAKSTSAEIDAIDQLIQQTPPTLKAFLTGKPIVDQEIQRIGKADLSLVELRVLPLTLVALWIVFGSVIAATMPVVMGAVTVSVTLGILYLITFKLSVSIFALNLTTMLGLGLGIDYALLMVSRFREELVLQSVEQAIAQTLNTAGRAVFFSGLTVCIGLVCLMLFPIGFLQSLGMSGAIVVLLSVAAALTLLPALLGVIGQRIRHSLIQPTKQRFWTVIARAVVRHRLASAVIVLMIVAGLSLPFLSARFGLGGAEILPKISTARAGVEVLQRSFGAGEIAPILLSVQTKSSDSEANILSSNHLSTLYRWVAQLQSDPRVASVKSLVNLDPRWTVETYQQLYHDSSRISDPKLATVLKQLSHHSTTLVIVKSRTDSHDAASRDLVRDLRASELEGLTVQAAGQTANELDTIAIIQQRFPIVLAALMSATFIVLCILLRSVVLPVKAIVMNLLSIGASFGALVFIFQQGHLQTELNFVPVGYLDALLPVVLFCVLFGLSMDYEVFLLTRIQEAYERCGRNTESVIEGLEYTGSIITSAAMLIIIVTSAFAFSTLIFVKALGLGIAIAIFIDATLIRAILVPATMTLLGRWNWWSPRFLHLDLLKKRQTGK